MEDGSGWRPLRQPVTKRPATPFQRLTTAHALSLGGDALITLALAGSLFFSISPTAARGRVTVSLLLTMAPFAVVSPLLGPAIDRSRRGRRAMVVLSCAGRAIACFVMARVLHGLLLFPAAFTVLVLSKAYAVSKSALVPSAVRGEADLVEANAKLAITGVVAGFLAAAPGVVVLHLAGAAWVLRLAAVVFAAAGVAALRIRPTAAPPGAPARASHTPAVVPAEPSTAPAPALASASALASATPRDRGRRTIEQRKRLPTALEVRAAAVVMALLRAEVGFLAFLIAFGFRRAGGPTWWFGLLLAASMGGTLAGSALAPRLRARLVEERILLGALGLVALCGACTALVDGELWGMVVAAAVGVAAGAGKLAFDALVQAGAPDAVRGQTFARYEAGFQLVWVVGALLPVVVATPLQQGYVVLAVASLAAAVAYVLAERHLGRSAGMSDAA